MRILIAEDERITRRSLQKQLEGWGHDVVASVDGAEAWGQFQRQQFDIVVTDWDMPRMDGQQLIEHIRGRERQSYTYLIMLTGRSEKADLVTGMEAGADDFLAKPFDRNELRVRLNAGEQIIQLERKLAAQNEVLQKANDRMKRDLDAAARVQETLLPEGFPEVQGWRFAWTYRPCEELAGDALNIVRINDDLIALYLLDVSGHGVPSALLSVTATRSLTPRAGGVASLVAGPGDNPVAVDPVQVASRLNALYPMASNGGHYFTMIYGLLDVRTRRLRFTVAGHPAPVLVRMGDRPKLLDVSGFPIGLIGEAEFEESEIDLRPGDRLYLYSDGLTEEMNAQQEQFGGERLVSAIADSRTLSLNDSVESLVQKVIAWRGEDHLKDDVSILAIAVA